MDVKKPNLPALIPKIGIFLNLELESIERNKSTISSNRERENPHFSSSSLGRL